MAYPTVSINIVTWNSMRFLPDLLKSIKAQTYTDFSVLIIDNNSDDGIEKYVREHYPEVTFLRNPRNLGFSAAHNQGIKYVVEHVPVSEHQERFVLVTNPDVILEETFLEKLIASTKATPEVGVYGGKLLRAFGENLGDEVFQETVKSDRIDSAGLNPQKNRTVTDRGAGEMDKGQFDKQEEVFGISGALAMYRVSALQEVKQGEEYYDHDFFAYKEDVDMAWRLQSAGWNALYVPKALAYHYRGMYGPEKSGLLQKIKNRKQKSSVRNYYSTRNHWLMLVKNLRFGNLFLAFPRLAFYEGARFVFVLFFENKGLRVIFDTWSLLPKMLKKRRDSLRIRKRTAKELRAWFV